MRLGSQRQLERSRGVIEIDGSCQNAGIYVSGHGVEIVGRRQTPVRTLGMKIHFLVPGALEFISEAMR